MNELTDTLYSPAAEEAIVGAAITDPALIQELDLSPFDFYIRKHGIIWEVMQSILQRGDLPDFITLGNELDKRGQLQEIGGAGYLAGLISGMPLIHHPQESAKIVRELASRRQVVKIATDLAVSAGNKTASLDTSLSDIMTQLSTAINRQRGAIPWSFHLSKADTVVQERAANPTRIWGMQTGYAEFDAATGGLQKSELLVLSGEPGVGKSFFTLQLAIQLAQEHPGALYSLEMTGEAVAMRALAMQSKLYTRTLKSGLVSPVDWASYYAALQDLAILPIYMSDETGWTTPALRADLARLKQNNGIEWFVVDYSYLMADGEGRLTETERTGMIMTAMKNICKSLNLAGVVIHSMNKAGMAADNGSQVGLRGSGQVSYDADLILFLTVPDKMHPEVIRCKFGKGRELEKPNVHFDLERRPGSTKFTPATATVTDLTKVR